MADPDLQISGEGGGGASLDPSLHGIMIVLFFTTKVSSLISVEGGKAISLSLNEINIPNT